MITARDVLSLTNLVMLKFTTIVASNAILPVVILPEPGCRKLKDWVISTKAELVVKVATDREVII